ncbi:MAG TPA: phosphoribosylanthranilate isomerase [Alphaproteobacteria bacterium]|jgi:phosphoribosylanthranilate isomerase|nr:phosphoribosylanthranilate isomerase [Alphaproteobacteria bacterium]
MTRLVQVKICGINEVRALDAAERAGADFVGFVFYPRSPRHVTLDLARTLGATVRSAKKIAVMVDEDDAAIAAIVDVLEPDFLQLHGSETPARVAAIRARFDVAVVKSFSVSNAQDLAPVPGYDAADMLLFDTRPPATGNALPGGNAVSFDWSLLHGRTFEKPWFLSGGLDAANVADAVRQCGARLVDVSSGVETAPGRKDPQRIAHFIAALEGVAA